MVVKDYRVGSGLVEISIVKSLQIHPYKSYKQGSGILILLRYRGRKQIHLLTNHWYWNKNTNTVFINLKGVDPNTNGVYISTDKYGITAAGDHWTIENLDLGYYNIAIVPKKVGSIMGTSRWYHYTKL